MIKSINLPSFDHHCFKRTDFSIDDAVGRANGSCYQHLPNNAHIWSARSFPRSSDGRVGCCFLYNAFMMLLSNPYSAYGTLPVIVSYFSSVQVEKQPCKAYSRALSVIGRWLSEAKTCTQLRYTHHSKCVHVGLSSPRWRSTRFISWSQDKLRCLQYI